MNADYTSYYYKQKRKKKQPKWWLIFAILLIVGGFITFIFLYPKLSQSTNYMRAVPQKSKVEVFEQFFYGVETGKFSTEGTAKSFATTIQKAGGAGYILCENETYFVLTSIYARVEDAEKVAAKLKNSNYNASVFPMKIPYTLISVTGKAKGVAKCLGYAFELLEGLEKLSNELSARTIDLTGAIRRLESARKATSTNTAFFDTVGINSVQGDAVRAYYMNIISALDELITSSSDTSELHRETRHLSIDALLKFVALVQELNK